MRRACADLLLRVADFAPDDVLDEMEIEDPYELTGLYDGIALTERSVMHQPTRPGRRLALPPADPRGVDRPRRRGARPAGSHVLVHEIAHHLGWSDDDIRGVDDWTE